MIGRDALARRSGSRSNSCGHCRSCGSRGGSRRKRHEAEEAIAKKEAEVRALEEALASRVCLSVSQQIFLSSICMCHLIVIRLYL